MLKENEKQRNNLVEKLKICDIENVTKAMLVEIEKLESSYKGNLAQLKKKMDM